MSLTLTCNIESITDSRIPEIKIMEMLCNNNIKIKMDMHRKLNLFKPSEKVTFVISKNLPQYNEGKDFVAHGYVVAKRSENENIVIYISLWGFLVLLTTSDEEVAKSFNVMDKVYIKISH
ncbi:MAG: DNA-directed RNA polymerase subunit G [Ignisphaera sp.]